MDVDEVFRKEQSLFACCNAKLCAFIAMNAALSERSLIYQDVFTTLSINPPAGDHRYPVFIRNHLQNHRVGLTMNTDYSDLLQFTPVIDGHTPSVSAFAHTHAGDASSVRKQAVRLYYAVRDDIRYDPYTVDLTVDGMRASHTLSTGRAWCVPKAVLLAACCRVMGIPAGLGFADVRNHLTTARLKKVMNTDIFFWHGYTTIFIDGKWLKATPAFNVELCERFNLRTLEFDGISDSLFQPFDLLGNAHMEYIQYHGEFSDTPIDRIRATFERHYLPMNDLSTSDFDQDTKAENPPSSTI